MMLRRLLMLCLLAALPAVAPVQASDEVDYVGLASLLLKDGHYDRAEGALANVDESDEDLDRVRYFTLKGLIKLRNQLHAEAKEALNTAIAAGQEDPVVYLYLAQAHFGLNEYRETLQALQKAGAETQGRPEIVVFRAQAHWQLGEKFKAWDVLADASEQFPETGEFLRRRVFMLIDLGMYRAAAELGLEYIQRFGAEEPDLLAIGRALRQSGEPERALAFLEQAYLRYPGSKSAMLELAHTYLETRRTLAAARLFEQAAAFYPELTSEASELYRDAGHTMHALNLNARTADSQKKFKQRLALLVQLEQFEQVAAMERDLKRVGLTEEGSVRYALAYAFFKTGRFEKAESYLAGLSDPDLFKQATNLRSAMSSCEESPWACL
ncbi:tetratricopeptide repeat protein [Algiphilus sp.]|uniref:tetratricopeptide repeat protein n=1 Tax=Algiphilus sp. TaxID=1872431 RepID=UPI002A5C09C5|nr:tetratricopeptide repeat protein [Pseudomonadota bacterium]